MGRYTEYKQVKETLNEISQNPQKYILIHYSTSSIKEEEFPKISSISLMKYENRDKIQFSICKYIDDRAIEEAEEILFDNFFQFIENNKNQIFIHWNMNSEKFGFEGFENRYNKLTKKNKNILGYLNKIDLDDLLEKYYSEKYISNPKMYNLYELNSFSIYHFIEGGKEAELYDEEKWFDISDASLAKVSFIYDVLKATLNKKLKVQNRFLNDRILWSDKIQYFFNEKLLGRFLFWLIVTLFASILSAFVSNFILKK